MSKPLIQKLDKITTKILFLKERGLCFHCAALACDTAHIISRRHKSVRWETEADGNVHLLCRKCHVEAHSLPHAYENWYAARYDGEALQALRRRSQRISMMLDCDLGELLEKKRVEYARLKDEALPPTA